MKFRLSPKTTPNGLTIGKWYRDRDGFNKWKVVDHKRIFGPKNVWRDENLTKDSKCVFCFSTQTNIWPMGTVVKVDKNSLL